MTFKFVSINLCIVLFSMTCEHAVAQSPCTFPYTLNKREATLVLIPIVAYSTRTDFSFGALSATNFHTDSLSNNISTLQFFVTYTLRNQFVTKLKNFLYLTAHDKYLLKGDMYYNDFAEDTYQRGGMTDVSKQELIGYKFTGVSQQFLRNIIPRHKLYVGLSYQYEVYWDFINLTLLKKDLYFPDTKNMFFKRSVLGVAAILDKRDRINAPLKGLFLECVVRADIPFLGATQYAWEFTADARYYYLLSLEKSRTLAFRLYTHYVFGDVPYFALPRVGENNASRGLPEGRYRNNYFTTLEAEFRTALCPKSNFWLLKRIQFNLFSSLNFIDEGVFLNQSLTPALGIGLRYVFEKKAGTSLRLDLGLGLHNNKTLDITANEAY